MSYCPHCGNEVHDEAIICVKCGCAIKPLQEENNDIPTIAKILMILTLIGYACCGLSAGLYVGVFVIWYIGLAMGLGFSLPIIWGIPMTIHLCKKIKNNEPISKSFKIWTLLTVSIVAGIILLCDHNN